MCQKVKNHILIERWVFHRSIILRSSVNAVVLVQCQQAYINDFAPALRNHSQDDKGKLTIIICILLLFFLVNLILMCFCINNYLLAYLQAKQRWINIQIIYISLLRWGKQTKELNSMIILWIVVLLIKKQTFLLVRNVRTKETELHKELATIIIL